MRAVFLTAYESDFITGILDNTAETVKSIGSYIITIIGIITIIYAIVMMAKALASKGQANWFIIIFAFLIGGALAVSGWNILTNEFGSLGKDTLENAAGSTPSSIGDFDSDIDGYETAKSAAKGFGLISKNFFVPFGKCLAICVGVILVIIAVYYVAKYFLAGGKAAASWGKVITMAILGSVLFTATPTNNDGGWTWVRDWAIGGTKDTIETIVDEGSSGDSNGINAGELGDGNLDSDMNITDLDEYQRSW